MVYNRQVKYIRYRIIENMSHGDHVVFGLDLQTVDGASLRVTSIRCTVRDGEAGVSSTERLHGYSTPVAPVQKRTWSAPSPDLWSGCVVMVDLKESECMTLFDFLRSLVCK